LPAKWIYNDNGKIKLKDECSNFMIIVECYPSLYDSKGSLIVTAAYRQTSTKAIVIIENKEFELGYTGGPAGRLFIGVGTNSTDFVKLLLDNSHLEDNIYSIKVKVDNEILLFDSLPINKALNQLWNETDCEAFN